MKISVIITTFNRPKLLQRALSSVLKQTLKPFEVIVVDDGSKDRLKTLEGIKYIYKQNGGISSARNLGIKKAKGNWVAFLDDDDEWDETKLEKQVTFHKTHPNILCSYTDEKWIKNGIEVKVAKRYQKPSKTTFSSALSHCFIAPSSVMLNKKIFEKLGFFDEGLEVCEDYDMWLRVLDVHKMGLVDEKLSIKHAHEGEQLGFKHYGMDRFRVRSLLKILPSLKKAHQQEAIKALQEKLNLLIKGAKKHEKTKDVKKYEYIRKIKLS